MTIPPKYQKLATLIGALGVAIIASALWDFAFRPLFLSISQGITAVAVAIYEPLRDSLYAEIARGRTDRAA